MFNFLYNVQTFPDGKTTQDEIIDTKTNQLFTDCVTAWAVEDRYED